MRRGAGTTLVAVIATLSAVLGCGSRSSLPLPFWTDDGSSDSTIDSGFDLVGSSGGTTASSGGAPSGGGGPAAGGAPATGGSPGGPCSLDNGGCDPLTACGVVDDFLMCGPCPDGYGGTGSMGCTHPTGLELTYLKPHAPGESDLFGTAVALSADGLTLAVGAPGEEGSSIGVNGDPSSLGAPASGAVTIYRYLSGQWLLYDYIKAADVDADDSFGWAVALSEDGSSLVVGAPGEDSSSAGLSGNEADDSLQNSGAAYLFRYSGATWVQAAFFKASNPDAFDYFGTSVAISSSGSTIAVGAPDEQSLATDAYGDQNDNSASAVGAVYTFEFLGLDWKQGYVKPPNARAGQRFGSSVALSAPGSLLAVGAVGESSGATGVNGDQSDDSAGASGAVYTFTQEYVWTLQAYIKASNTSSVDRFGSAVSLSATGDTLAVGAWSEESLSSGVDGNQSDNNGAAVGAAYVFFLDQPTWVQAAYIKASNPQDAHFGVSLALSGDGNTLIVGAPEEQGAAVGVNGDQTASLIGAGAAYLFQDEPAGWAQTAYLKASNTDQGDAFGTHVAIDFDGRTMAIGAMNESSSSSGVNGNGTSNDVLWSGAAYVYSSE